MNSSGNWNSKLNLLKGEREREQQENFNSREILSWNFCFVGDDSMAEVGEGIVWKQRWVELVKAPNLNKRFTSRLFLLTLNVIFNLLLFAGLWEAERKKRASSSWCSANLQRQSACLLFLISFHRENIVLLASLHPTVQLFSHCSD